MLGLDHNAAYLLWALGITVVYLTPAKLRDAMEQQATVVRTALMSSPDRTPAEIVTEEMAQMVLSERLGFDSFDPDDAGCLDLYLLTADVELTLRRLR